MKKIQCHDCRFQTSTGCSINKKNGYNNCQEFRAIPIDVLKKEYYDLVVSGENPERKNYLEEKLKRINGGTI